ncbi:mycofactocin system transcriptional regulator [Nocardioides aequoreus]|uniref:mycofactocin system transcriptional regulator n=1 Tax=Nocardioides aequoreus TaxID=397278 RepID=UPI0004C410C4|nr:mycofactocin system transcriptional regulator [Nocardioides aequoreus]
MTEEQGSRGAGGRPVATTHAAIEQATFRLFRERGFEGTTLDDIAREVGVSRRTLFRYFPSKNDIAWGQFDRTLETFRETLATMPEELPLHEAVHRAVVAFNVYDEHADPPHRERMHLILTTPALSAHSVHRYADWRAVIAEYVAARRGLAPTDPLPEVVSQVALALALSAYTLWLREPGPSLRRRLEDALLDLRAYLA